MAKYENPAELDYRNGGDTVDDFAQKYMRTVDYIIKALNDLRTPTGNTAGVDPEPYMWRIADNKLYIRNADNTSYVLLGEISPNFGFRQSVNDRFLTTADLEGEGAVVTRNEAGKVEGDITGSPGKIANKTIDVTPTADNDVIAYDAAQQKWVKKTLNDYLKKQGDAGWDEMVDEVADQVINDITPIIFNFWYLDDDGYLVPLVGSTEGGLPSIHGMVGDYEQITARSVDVAGNLTATGNVTAGMVTTPQANVTTLTANAVNVGTVTANDLNSCYYINPTMTQDEIKSICATHNFIYFIPGSYTFTPRSDSDYWIAPQSNSRLVFAENAFINVTPNAYHHYYVIKLADCESVIVDGGHLIGDKDTHDYSDGTTHEWCHGVYVSANTKNILLTKMEVSEFPGDGIEVSGTATVANIKDTIISYCHIHDCGRQGISVTDCDGLIITKCYIHDIDRVAPMAAIDFEPWVTNRKVINAIVSDCTFKNTYQGILAALTFEGTESGIDIHDCNIANVSMSMIRIIGTGNASNLGYVNIHDLQGDNVAKPVYIGGVTSDSKLSIDISKIIVTNGVFNDSSTDDKTAILVYGANGHSTGNVTISDVSIKSVKDNDYLNYAVFTTGLEYDNITVNIPSDVINKQIRIIGGTRENISNFYINEHYVNNYIEPSAEGKATHIGTIISKREAHTFASSDEETLFTETLNEPGLYRFTGCQIWSAKKPAGLSFYKGTVPIAQKVISGDEQSIGLECVNYINTNETVTLKGSAAGAGTNNVYLNIEKIL